MKIVFLDQATMGDDISFKPFEELGDYHGWPLTSPDEVVSRISDAEVVIVNKVVIGKPEIDAAPRLKLICVAATGTNNIDVEYALSKGIPVKNVKGYSTESVTQITFSLILALLDHILYFDSFVKSGEYSRGKMYSNLQRQFSELNTMVFGIIGMGDIGKNVARIATAFGAKVQYYSTSGVAHCKDYPMVKLNELLGTSDIISIHSPLNDRTKNLITIKELRMMNNSAIIVNIGRGGIINEADLARAIDEGVIAGAAVDVYEKEPLPVDHPYLKIKNSDRILLTPHVGWASIQARTLLASKIAENIKSFFKI
jgi:glycerate dehydrogenase